jgi:hypothetical protein
VTIPELLTWCEEHHEQDIYVHAEREAGQVTLFADDGALPITAELWDELVDLLTAYRPDVAIEPGL